MSEGDYDSIRAAKRLTQSTRVKALVLGLWAIITASWTYVGPFVYAAVGWVISRAFIADDLLALKLALDENTRVVAELKVQIASDRSQDQRDVFAIGRQAAFAAAGFQAHEPAKLRQQKRDYADKYAASFERIAREKGAAVAMASLFENVNLP